MIHEAVILAGGFGTRLSHVIGDIPKPMAPVAGKPFLTYVLDGLCKAGITKVILATGYKHEIIARYFGSEYNGMSVDYSQEKEPLFTGGAIAQASAMTEGSDFLVLNGDTLFDIDYSAFCRNHERHNNVLTIALRQVENTERYGAVEVTGNIISTFREKDSSAGAGLINGGIYVVNKEWLSGQNMPRKFSFEKDLLQAKAHEKSFSGVACSQYFIDIGVADDYYRAQYDFRQRITQDRYLFLDRDGVLNRQIIGDYVRNISQWEWLPNVLSTMKHLSERYSRVFIVSNQQGIGKGLLTSEDLERIHKSMLSDIELAGGRIDGVYVCPDLADSDSGMRKPAIGMALTAKKDFPEVDFTRSVMAGDSLTDMQFGYNAGMRCVYITKGQAIPPQIQDYTDLWIESLECLPSLCL